MLTEADTCRTYVLPKLYAAGWNDDQIGEQRSFTDGRIIVPGTAARRGSQKRADDLLRYRPNLMLAVVEAKASYKKSRRGSSPTPSTCSATWPTMPPSGRAASARSGCGRAAWILGVLPARGAADPGRDPRQGLCPGALKMGARPVCGKGIRPSRPGSPAGLCDSRSGRTEHAIMLDRWAEPKAGFKVHSMRGGWSWTGENGS
jgi:hypothetical protein